MCEARLSSLADALVYNFLFCPKKIVITRGQKTLNAILKVVKSKLPRSGQNNNCALVPPLLGVIFAAAALTNLESPASLPICPGAERFHTKLNVIHLHLVCLADGLMSLASGKMAKID